MYETEAKFNSSFKELHEDTELAVFHLNVRSLNSHRRQLCQFLRLLCMRLDVIILSEI
jgi:hypothetical protein